MFFPKLKTKNGCRQNGFTLIETFVAITILMIAILGPLQIIARFYIDSRFSQNQIASSFLAQEAIETVGNIVANNTAAEHALMAAGASCTIGREWLAGLEPCEDDDGCNIDSLTGRICSADEESCRDLKKDVSGFYRSGDISEADEETGFGRSIKITDIVKPDNTNDLHIQPDDYGDLREALVTVTVTWPRGSSVTQTLISEPLCP